MRKAMSVHESEPQLLEMLARVVNGSGKPRQAERGEVVTADVPVELLRAARDLLRLYQDTELSSSGLRQAAGRSWA